MVETMDAPRCMCEDADFDDEDYVEHDPNDRLKPLPAEVAWADGRVDTVPTQCEAVGIGVWELEQAFPTIASVTVADEESRTEDSATMTVLQVSDDVFLKTVSGEAGGSTLLRGQILDVLIDAMRDWDGSWPLWETYLKEVGATLDDTHAEDDDDDSSRWQTVSIYLDEADERELISRLQG